MFLQNYTKEFSYNLKLSFPIILGLLGHTLVGMIDNIMVGKLDPTNLAAVSLGNSFIFIAMSIGIGFSAAITPVVAEAHSKKHDKDLMKSFEESGVSISEDEWSAIREKLVKEFAEDARREHRDDLADSMATADEIVGKLTGEDKNDESKFLDDTLIKEMKDLEESDYSEYDMDKSLAISS